MQKASWNEQSRFLHVRFWISVSWLCETTILETELSLMNHWHYKCFMCMFVIIFFFLTGSVWCNWAEIIRNSCSCSCIIGFSSVKEQQTVCWCYKCFHDCHYWFYCGKPGGRGDNSVRISFFRLNGELCPKNYYLNKFLRLKCSTTNANLMWLVKLLPRVHTFCW